MSILKVLYTAPLPAGFSSGTLTLKRDEVYIDAAGNKALAQQVARIGADRSLTDVATGQALTTVGAGQGDPLAGLLTWVETLYLSGQPDPVRSSHKIAATYTAPGQLSIHRPNDNARTVGSAADASGEAQAAAKRAVDASAAAALLQGLTLWAGGDHTTLPVQPGLYRLTSGAEAGQVWERTASGTLARNTALEAANSADVAQVAGEAQAAQDAADTASLLARLATRYQSNTTALPAAPSQAEQDAYAAAGGIGGIPGSNRTADGGVQRLRYSGGAWAEEGNPTASVPQVNIVRSSIGAIDAKRFGVLPNGSDMMAALSAALTSGEHLTITQPGDYVLDNGANGPLHAYGLERSLTMLPGTRLLIRDNTKRGVWIHSPRAIELSLNVEYQTPATARAENMHGIQIDDALDVLLTRVRSVGAPAIACMVYRGQRVIVGHAHVEGNMADGLHFYNVIDAHLGSLRGYNNGDDTLAYHGKPGDGDQGQGYGLTAGSVISRNAHASGIACIGSGQVIVGDFLIANSGVDGIRLDSGTGYGGQDPFGLGEASRITLGRGRIIDAGRNPKSVTPGSESHGIRVGAVKGGCRIGEVDIVNPKTHGLYARATEYLALGEVTAEVTGGMGYLLDSVGHVDHQGAITAKNTGNLGYRAVGCALLTGQAPTIINAGANPVLQVDGGVINWTTPLGVTDTRNPSTGRAVTFTAATGGKVAGIQGVFATDALVLNTGNVQVGRVSGLSPQALSKPAFPGNGQSVSNTLGYDVTVYVFNGSDPVKNVTGLFVNGAQAASGPGMVRLRLGDSIIVNYGGAADPDKTGPGWLWQPV